jgi:hypothetical protein
MREESPVTVLACVLTACVLLAGLTAAAEEEAAEPAKPQSPPLSCTIKGPATCELGQVPAISVELTNWTDKDIYLVGSLDASDMKWRYPFCYFEIRDAIGNPVKVRVGRCGNMNAIREKDFVRVAPGGKFDPYQTIDEGGFFGSSQMIPQSFASEGEYRIRFVYSTEAPKLDTWLGDRNGIMLEVLPTGAPREKLLKLLEQVPRTTVSSNEITVKVEKPKQAQAD